MLPGGYSAVLKAKDRDEFRDEIVRFAQRLGFDTVAAVTVLEHGMAGTEFISVDNTPQAYSDAFRDTVVMRRDPVMQHCRKQSVPIIWDQQTYTGQGLGDLWEEQAQFGYNTGIAMALHLPEGRHFVLGVDRDKPLPADAAELQRVVADLQLFAVHAQEAALRLLVPEPMQPEKPALTPRELEALHWTMEGKTAWEVGHVLGITERTAVLHVNNATHKLGCVNKHQAVLRALRLGLLR
jgi:DNA-binding CsgD family transcriptional regulator